MMAVLVVWFGHGGLVAAFFLAVLPYAFDQGRGVGEFLVLMASLAYLGACVVHNRLYEGGAPLETTTLIETGVFILVVMSLKQIPAPPTDPIPLPPRSLAPADHALL